MMTKEQNKVFSQMFFWAGGWLVVTFILTRGMTETPHLVPRGVANFIGILLITGVNLSVLLPRFYLKKRIIAYVLSSAGLIFTTTFLIHADIFPWSDYFNFLPLRNMQSRLQSQNPQTIEVFYWMGQIVPFIIALGGTTLIQVTRFANQREKMALLSEKEQLATELKFLKSQVNPHFLFNTLNNIYSLTVTKSDDASESIMQLSEILRYMVYEANEKYVTVEEEIRCIENYIGLMCLKDKENLNVEFSTYIKNAHFPIAPLLFIPLIENAFKHSRIEQDKEGEIAINLTVIDEKIQFSVENSLPKTSKAEDKNIGGVGLNNVQKRLNLLYPDGQHQLAIKQNRSHFSVQLSIQKKHHEN